MKLRNSLLLLPLFLLLSIAACSPSQSIPTSAQPTLAADQPVLSALNRDLLSSYSSTFTIRFEGSNPWMYQLITRKTIGLREEGLHIEGVDQASNPGDIRLVTDSNTTWMIGAGTDNECVQFPNNQGMDPTFILPESLVSIDEVAGALRYAGEEEINGQASLHFQGSGLSFGGWKKAQVGVWQAKDSQALLRFVMQAAGEDPFFVSGVGTITARYDAVELGAEAIEPIAGCEVSVPLPDTATLYVRLPGMASFVTAAGVAEMQNFYQQVLGQEGWVEKEPPAQSDSAVVLSYSRGAEEVQIHIEAAPGGGSKVKLIFLQGN